MCPKRMCRFMYPSCTLHLGLPEWRPQGCPIVCGSTARSAFAIHWIPVQKQSSRQKTQLSGGKVLILFCWKAILPYGDTCHLILRRGIETRKVSGADWVYISGTLCPYQKLFFWTRHSSSPRNFCRSLSSPQNPSTRAPGIQKVLRT